MKTMARCYLELATCFDWTFLSVAKGKCSPIIQLMYNVDNAISILS